MPVINLADVPYETFRDGVTGHYVDEHETPVVDFTKLSVQSVSLANHCKARPDENVIWAADRVFGK